MAVHFERITRNVLHMPYPHIVRHWRAGLLVVVGALTLASCARTTPTEVEVEVRDVGFDADSHAPVVVLQDRDRKVALPIWIGPNEAQAIVTQLHGVVPPRPMTHDLMKTILEQTGSTLDRVVIEGLASGTYYARIWLRADGQTLQIDSRPSDAIALAMRCGRPIFITTGLLRDAPAIDLQRLVPAAGTERLAGVTVQNLTDAMAEYFSVPAGGGVVVADVAGDAPPGLQRGDVIVAVDGATVTGVGDFVDKLRAQDRTAELSVRRGAERLAVAFRAGR